MTLVIRSNSSCRTVSTGVDGSEAIQRTKSSAKHYHKNRSTGQHCTFELSVVKKALYSVYGNLFT